MYDGGWFTATAVIAGHGWYNTRLGHGVPWLPIAVAGFFGTLLAQAWHPAPSESTQRRGEDNAARNRGPGDLRAQVRP